MAWTKLGVVAVALASLCGACGSGDTEGGGPAGELSASGAPRPTAAGAGTVLRLDPRFSGLVPPGARIEQVAGGFVFTEGPLWDAELGGILFSDVGGNALYRWNEADGASALIPEYFQGDTEGRQFFGPNGLTRDAEGRLVIADQGGRQITRVEPDGTRAVLVDSYQGARLNSPNDLVYRSDGSLYFTDPPYGLAGLADSPLQELEVSGVYRLPPAGALELLVEDLALPNGLAFSPDESVMYVASTDPPLWMAYDVTPEGGLANPRVFLDAGGAVGQGGADGLKVDRAGNVYATGPGGVWVIAPDGTHLGTISPTEAPANVAWGEDGRTLYMTAATGLYRIRLTAEGAIP